MRFHEFFENVTAEKFVKSQRGNLHHVFSQIFFRRFVEFEKIDLLLFHEKIRCQKLKLEMRKKFEIWNLLRV